MAAEPAARRFRVGEVPPLAEGYTERPDTARGIMDALAPGTTLALVPGSAFAEGPSNWLGACGKTQIAVIVAESLWRSTAIDALVWISATSREAVPSGRVLVTSMQASLTSGRRGIQVIPVGFFSIREALNCLTERLSVNPVQRHGAIDLIEALGREPLALAQAASVVANSTLACRDYRDYFARRRQQIGVAAGEVPSAAAVTWTLSLGQAESLLPGASIRLMLVLVALLDGHGIPGSIFSTSAVAAYLGGAATAFSTAVNPKPAWDALLAVERAGLVSVNRTVSPPTILVNSVLQAAIRLAAPANVQEPAARAAANALLEIWPVDEAGPWTAVSLRSNAASLHDAAPDVLWADGCHPLLLRAGRSLDNARLVGPAVEYWRDLSARCDTKLIPGHPDALVVASHLAGAYLAAGYASEAVHWYQRVLAERGRELAPGHPAIIAARVNLAKALILAGEPADAIAVLDRAVSECEQFRGPGHPDTLNARDDLAAAHQAAGDVSAAARLLSRNLIDRERLQGPRDAETMATRDRLAAACLAAGKVKDAISHYKRALSDREKVLGSGHPDTTATTANLAATYQAAGRMPAAMQLAEQCCADSERVLGSDHSDTLTRMANLAYLFYAVGRVGDGWLCFATS